MSQSPVKLIRTRRHADTRGWFAETYNVAAFLTLGVTAVFRQDNHSLSRHPFTLRGLHFQTPPRAQDKVVRCVRGSIFDVAVDIRRGSPTFGRWVAAVLSSDNGDQLFIPAGFAHGFLTLEAESEVAYKCSDTYAPDHEGGVAWDSVGVDWPLPDGRRPELSFKDEALTPLSDFDSPFTYNGGPLEPLA